MKFIEQTAALHNGKVRAERSMQRALFQLPTPVCKQLTKTCGLKHPALTSLFLLIIFHVDLKFQTTLHEPQLNH